MSKSKYNVINPDDIIDQNGADCFRMFEMFLGPIEHAKPWDTQSIGGVSKFLQKLWRLFDPEDTGHPVYSDQPASEDDLKALAVPVLAHRLQRRDGGDAGAFVRELVARIHVEL